MRPTSEQRLPTLFQFTIYVDSARDVADVRRSADHGYAGVIAYTRGKACSPQAPVPYRHDGADAAAVIDWIARQPWSDGQVGMYGGSYSGFTTWAAVKYRPKALKAIMVGAPVAPAIDVPMEGNIVWNFIYPWPYYTTNNKTLDDSTYNDPRWWKLNRSWYVSGRAYNDLDKIDGTPNPFWNEWVSHPSYDAYWRALIPYGDEFAKIDIPVLQTAGYFYGGPGAAVYYFTQHLKYKPNARHYLLIGPYDHRQAQRGVVSAAGDTVTSIAGYETDPVARMNIVADLRYPFFDWVLKGGPKPALLADRMNYEVMGANMWKHAPSIDAMSNGKLRFYLNPSLHLSRVRALPDSGATVRADLSYRADIDTILPGGGVRDTAVNAYLSLVYVSDPLTEPMEVSGLYSGHLEFVTNKRDFDLGAQLFELTPDGHYMQLPPFQVRASYNSDRATRRLLTPGARETMNFTAERLISRRLERGSRIVLVIGPIKGPGQQINYGSGKDVNAETVQDAGAPMEIRFLGASYVEVPVRR